MASANARLVMTFLKFLFLFLWSFAHGFTEALTTSATQFISQRMATMTHSVPYTNLVPYRKFSVMLLNTLAVDSCYSYIIQSKFWPTGTDMQRKREYKTHERNQ